MPTLSTDTWFQEERKKPVVVEEIYCTYDPTSKAGTEGANRKVKGTIHWVSCAHCLPAEVRNYACLWTCENPRDAIKQYEDENGVRGIDAMRPSSILTAFASTAMPMWKNMCKTPSAAPLFTVHAYGLLQYRPRLPRPNI